MASISSAIRARTALEAVTAAAEDLRAALAARDQDPGLVWMYDNAEVCWRWNALDAACDALNAARQTVGIDEELLEQNISDAVGRIAGSVAADQPARRHRRLGTRVGSAA